MAGGRGPDDEAAGGGPGSPPAALTPEEPAAENTHVAVPRISREDLHERLQGAHPPIVVDARLKYPFEHSTVMLPGAVRLLADDPLPVVPSGTEVVVYDSDPNELASSRMAARFIRGGVRAAALKGGIVEWLAAGLPVQTKAAPRQAAPEPGALKG